MEPLNLPLRIWYRALPPAQREFFDERAAIIEFDAATPRDNAERQAAKQTAIHFNIPPPTLL